MTRRRIPAKPVDGFRSKLEKRISEYLTRNELEWQYEAVTLHCGGRKYTPDFLAWGAFTSRMVIEVKPSLEIARQEVRADMLHPKSPLWMIADVFIVATPECWKALADGGRFVECVVSRDGMSFPEGALA